ncbi:glycoside hydrolase family 3 N-terminal domain-containing protein [Rhodohalobacter sp.]|uniref:glycoside hydrolase family 3 N-terminal domain-containing protein n=1 Tax=Rhodohalobacter sp. TaxID=1974210 RepID=UPI002ACD6852|nr:glycoside hydrolase family 3 N-terminal domain-containing protein [Rhodohalobacter sp.]MDZ7757303.1 glycoside hydrolase family 3 N-terminal domain-containing protein [Rhodohalobacter sp.]
MKKLHLLIVLSVLLAFAGCGSTDIKNSSKSSIDQKVDSLLSIMTLDEKIGQLTLYTSDMDQTGAFLRPEYLEDIKNGDVGAIFNAYGAEYTRKLQEIAVNETRLGIPLMFGYDVVHGHRTIFPVPLAEASSWDLDMMKQTAEIAAREGAAEGLHWTFAPMVDISKDPRWGRVIEGAGEDHYLGSRIAEVKVQGFQGDDLKDLNTLAATVKHFAGYGAAQAGRDYHSVDMSDRELREVYLPPFKAAIDAGAVSVMTAFNDLNGIPATANSYLFQDILRDEWGFDGFVVTDYTAIMELLFHGVAENEHQASKLALDAGVDMSMQDGYYHQTLADLVEDGRIEESQIDRSAGYVLRVKFQLGLFDDPFRYSSTERQEQEIMTPENIEAARDMAKRSIVLLKNENQLLPISEDIQTIAVIGPMGDNQRDMIGSWSAAGDWTKSVSLLQGLKNQKPDIEFIFVEGTGINDDSRTGFADAVEASQRADLVILALGESYEMSGEAASRTDISLPGAQEDLAREIHATGKPIVAVLMNGRPLTINWLDENIPSILETWFLGTTAGDAIADVLFGNYNPSGKLPMTFPRNVGQIPIHYNMRNTGRPFDPNSKYTTKYLDVENEPLYVFGYGLSYTTFDYSPVSLSSKSMDVSGSIDATVTVTNTGNRAGEEVVQFYLHDKVASVAPRVKQLKGFEKIYLEPGESKDVVFNITNNDLKFYRLDMSYGSEPGEFMIFIGGNSRDTQNAEFELQD